MRFLSGVEWDKVLSSRSQPRRHGLSGETASFQSVEPRVSPALCQRLVGGRNSWMNPCIVNFFEYSLNFLIGF